MCIQMRGYHVCVHIFVGVNPKKVCENMQVPAVESGGTVSQPGPQTPFCNHFSFPSHPPPFQTPVTPYHFLGGFLTENLTLL